MSGNCNTLPFSPEREKFECVINSLASLCRKQVHCSPRCRLYTQCSYHLYAYSKLEEFALDLRNGLVHGEKLPERKKLDIGKTIKEVDDILADVVDLECIIKGDIELEYAVAIKENLKRLKDKLRYYEFD